MGVLDSNQVVVKQQITSGTFSNIDLSTGGGKGVINTAGKNGLCIKYSKTGGDAEIDISPFSNYNDCLPLYTRVGDVYFRLVQNGIYWIDVTGIDSIYIYCRTAKNDTTGTITYYLANDAPQSLISIKPIQLVYSKDVSIAASPVSVLGISISKAFKYFYITCHYDKTVDTTSTAITCSGNLYIRDKMTVDGVERLCDARRLASWEDKKTFVSDFIENTVMATSLNGTLELTSGGTEGAVMHIRIYGIR